MSAHLEDELIELRGRVAAQNQLLQRCAAERDEAIAQMQVARDCQAAIATENARLFNETKEASERQTATSEILAAIGQSVSDATPVFEKILESCERLLAADGVAIFIVGDDQMVRAAAARGDRAEEVMSDVTPLAESITARVIRERKVHHVPDLGALPDLSDKLRDRVRRHGGASLIYAPMLWKDRGLGTIVARRSPPRPFGENEQALLKSFADQAAIAVENARLFKETQQTLERQTATSEILRVISRSPTDAKPVFDAIVLTAARLFGCQMASVFRVDGDSLTAVTAAWQERLFFQHELSPSIPIDPAANFPSRAVVSRKTVRADYSVPGIPEHERYIANRYGIVSALFLPLSRGHECIGVFLLTATRSGEFDEKDVALAESFRDQALIAIENARLFDEVEAKTRDLSEALVHQTASGNILKVIASSPTKVAPALQAIVESACEVCDAYDAAVILREGDHVRFSAHCGPIPIGLESWPLSRGWVGGRCIVD
jgi:two-component system, NtrC family, sensor kinase